MLKATLTSSVPPIPVGNPEVPPVDTGGMTTSAGIPKPLLRATSRTDQFCPVPYPENRRTKILSACSLPSSVTKGAKWTITSSGKLENTNLEPRKEQCPLNRLISHPTSAYDKSRVSQAGMMVRWRTATTPLTSSSNAIAG